MWSLSAMVLFQQIARMYLFIILDFGQTQMFEHLVKVYTIVKCG